MAVHYNLRASMTDERERVAGELRRIRDAVRERVLETPLTLQPPKPTRTPEALTLAATPPAPAPPQPPDGSAVNAAWSAKPARPLGALARVLERLLRPLFEAQVAFNSRQVQFDNQTLAYLEARLAATHRHYDEVLGLHGRHMAEIDERHLILQEELVAHVHDLVKRIDLVLAEAEKGRISLEFALRDVRARVAKLEERLSRG
jgi:hypothetical protein